MFFLQEELIEAGGWTYTEETSGPWDADQMGSAGYNLFEIFGFTF